MKVWILIAVLSNGWSEIAYFSTRNDCTSAALNLYAEYMDKPNRPEFVCASNESEVINITKAHDNINKKFKENPQPEKPWKEVEKEYDLKLSECLQYQEFGKPRPKCSGRIISEKREAYNRYKEKGLIQ